MTPTPSARQEAEWIVCQIPCRCTLKQVNDARALIEAALLAAEQRGGQAMKRYAVHLESCESIGHSVAKKIPQSLRPECTCGLDVVLRGEES